MTIQELTNKIASLGDTMDFCIEDVFSWRGSYDEPACTIYTNNTTKEHNLYMLGLLITEAFCGWKGGAYTYTEYSDIHFEEDAGNWSGGEFLNHFLLNNANNKDVKFIFS